jgi:hypothetical protein
VGISCFVPVYTTPLLNTLRGSTLDCSLLSTDGRVLGYASTNRADNLHVDVTRTVGDAAAFAYREYAAAAPVSAQLSVLVWETDVS